MKGFDESTCLNKLQKGGKLREHAITELYQYYALPFKRYFIKHKISHTDADDLVQETFINIVKYCKSFRGECPIKMWLWKVARNCMLTFFRKQKPQHDDIDVLADMIEDPKAEKDFGPTLEDCVKHAFIRFQEKHSERAEMLMLATIQGWSTQELTELLGRSLGATREYISQCRKHFKPYLDVCRDYI